MALYNKIPQSWFLLHEEDMLVPLKVDISYRGARYVDSFCWNCNPYTNTMSAYEFACRTCADMSLPDGFQYKIALQIQEQIDSYRLVLDMLRSENADKILNVIEKHFPSSQPMALGIRYQTVDCKLFLHFIVLLK